MYALVQHEVVWASETELGVTAADRAMTAAQDADDPLALAGAAWTLGMVQRSAGDVDEAITLAADAAALLEPRLESGSDELPAMYGALQLHAATTAARAGREGDAWRRWDIADATARRIGNYSHPWTMFGAANVKLHAVSISADLSKSGEAHGHAEQIDPDEIPSRERRGRLGVEIARAYHQRHDYPATLHWLETDPRAFRAIGSEVGLIRRPACCRASRGGAGNCVDQAPANDWGAVAGSDNWCDALYFPYGRRKLGGVHCRLEPGHDGDHWCEAEDEMEADMDS